MLIITASSGKNLELAHLIENEIKVQAASCQILDLCGLNLPLFHPEVKEQGAGPGFEELVQALRQHKGLFVCAPEYNGSIPPTLVNAIAWLSVATEDFRELFNLRPIALASHSGGGGSKLLLAMRQQFSHLGSTVLGRELLTTFQKPANPETIEAMVKALVELESLSS
jgi:NAD(P)H-dependent FMN reductase